MSHFQQRQGEITAAVSWFQNVGVGRPASMPVSGNAPVLGFGIFELDGQTLELRREGRLIHLRHQPALVLLRLLQRPRHLVTRDEITRELWPNDIDVDVEQGLNHCVKEIRVALGDRAEAPRYIQTLPRRGYRLLVEVAQARPWPPPASAARVFAPAATPMPPSESKANGRVRITLSVFRSRDHTALWSESFDHHAGALDGIASDITAALYGGVRRALDAEALRPADVESESGAETHVSRGGFE